MSSIAHFTYRLFASEPQSSPYRMVSVAKECSDMEDYNEKI